MTSLLIHCHFILNSNSYVLQRVRPGWSNFCTLVGHFSKSFEFAGLSRLKTPIFVPRSHSVLQKKKKKGLHLESVSTLDSLPSARHALLCKVVAACDRQDLGPHAAGSVVTYSVALCKVKQKKAQDIANELKCLREKAEYEFHQLHIFAQETAKAEDFILKTPRLTSRQTNRCNIAAATDEEHFRVGIFIPFLDNFIVTLEARFTAANQLLVNFSV